MNTGTWQLTQAYLSNEASLRRRMVENFCLNLHKIHSEAYNRIKCGFHGGLAFVKHTLGMYPANLPAVLTLARWTI